MNITFCFFSKRRESYIFHQPSFMSLTCPLASFIIFYIHLIWCKNIKYFLDKQILLNISSISREYQKKIAYAFYHYIILHHEPRSQCNLYHPLLHHPSPTSPTWGIHLTQNNPRIGLGHHRACLWSGSCSGGHRRNRFRGWILPGWYPSHLKTYRSPFRAQASRAIPTLDLGRFVPLGQRTLRMRDSRNSQFFPRLRRGNTGRGGAPLG